MSTGEMHRLGLTEQPKDPFRFVKYAGWAVGIFLCGWAMMYCGVYVDNDRPSNLPARYQAPTGRNSDIEKLKSDRQKELQQQNENRHDQREEPSTPDAGAYDYGE